MPKHPRLSNFNRLNLGSPRCQKLRDLAIHQTYHKATPNKKAVVILGMEDCKLARAFKNTNHISRQHIV